MKTVVMFEQEEFEEKFLQFCDNFLKQTFKGYGVKLISNESNKYLDSREDITGALFLTWQKTFREKS